MKNFFIVVIVLVPAFNMIGQVAGTLDPTFNGTGKVVYNIAAPH